MLLKIAQSEKFLAVTNQYRVRGDDQIISGIGCTLTHKATCQLTNFRVPSFFWNKRLIRCAADDFWFLAPLSYGNQIIKRHIGWSGRKVGRFVSIWHISEEGLSKFLKKDNVYKKKGKKK